MPDKQVLQMRMSRTRSEQTITHFPDVFPEGKKAGKKCLATVLRDHFGGRPVISLTDDEWPSLP